MSNFLVFARRTDIRKISLDVDYVVDVVIPLGEIRNAIAIGVDKVEGRTSFVQNNVRLSELGIKHQ